jgi:hypothetical protein
MNLTAKKPILEKTIEKKVCEYATKKGWLVYKFQSMTNRGVPDRIFMKQGKVFFIEFKQLGKDATPIQKSIHNRIKDIGQIPVHIVDTIELGQALLDSYDSGFKLC